MTDFKSPQRNYPSYSSKQPSSSLEVNLVRAALERLTGIHTMLRDLACSLYTAISRKGVGKNCARQSRKVIGYDQYTVPNTVAVEPTFVAFFKHSQAYGHGLSCHCFKFLSFSEE